MHEIVFNRGVMRPVLHPYERDNHDGSQDADDDDDDEQLDDREPEAYRRYRRAPGSWLVHKLLQMIDEIVIDEREP